MSHTHAVAQSRLKANELIVTHTHEIPKINIIHTILGINRKSHIDTHANGRKFPAKSTRTHAQYPIYKIYEPTMTHAIPGTRTQTHRHTCTQTHNPG